MLSGLCCTERKGQAAVIGYGSRVLRYRKSIIELPWIMRWRLSRIMRFYVDYAS